MNSSDAKNAQAGRTAVTVLNVNDDPATLYLLSLTLKQGGYQVLEATGGREALRLAQGRPDLVLLDVHMPDIDGYEVCRRLRADEATHDLLIAHLSSVSVQREDRVRGLAQGADAYWTRPLAEDELLANIEALLRLQIRARDAVRARDRFLSIAAHELKTPLTVLRLNLERAVEMVVNDADAGAAMEKRLTPAVRQLTRLQHLVDNLLDVSLLSTQGVALQVDTVDFSQLVREQVEHFQAPARSANVALTAELPDAPVLLFGDPRMLEQAVGHLLSNAIKFGEDRPAKARLSTHEGHAVLAVEDQGVGIAPEDHARVFRRFERVPSGGRFDGLGLGLYLAQEIAAAHDGTLSVKSAPGQGACFELRLPLHRTQRY
ncbi:hybrid sensor histidine kinase/response regulator [Corallococcus exiguus]|uniref:ATP-binding response regulator n=1 Tax=Corallococcus TaxID=83461 RepID=UPI000EED7E5E|nr:hybrid sensor histidine kinase/response regulator [Corallococcus sp. AB032C]NNB91341.1 hybrid sensor histidine kinase/response regulator [Corallococcus exiguus]NNB98152.1 hybrid sensor histidine kinase/response regulator [Corallococcus exiguus]NNC08277.1 hybrid sensor histidine kinase/response regulator [Corallococcus exiguus]NPC48451.1 hybrid sensor histidine kinase/response regulator [Corallococcus exiguus]RKH87358.1 hybrid sensor histidine kinase/response regulator [Corallococcus sp. AB0